MAKANQAPASQAEATKTLSGYAVQLVGFIPTPKGNLRAQAELTAVMADIEEGKKPFSAIFDLIQDRDFRVQPINRRYPEAKANAMLARASGGQADEEPEGDSAAEPEGEDDSQVAEE